MIRRQVSIELIQLQLVLKQYISVLQMTRMKKKNLRQLKQNIFKINKTEKITFTSQARY